VRHGSPGSCSGSRGPLIQVDLPRRWRAGTAGNDPKLSSAVLDLNSSGGWFSVLPPIRVVIEIGRAIPQKKGSGCRTIRIHLTAQPVLSYEEATHGGLMAYSPAEIPIYQEAEMAYERLDEALRQLKTDREREEATEKQQKREGEEARMRFAQIKSAVIRPIFNEIVAHLVAEGFFGEMVDEQSDASDPISLDANLANLRWQKPHQLTK
jgi:hypothetical protein